MNQTMSLPAMEVRRLTVEFLTPAFLGAADQAGQWRTPPFKHLLREWWRVAWVAAHPSETWQRMRREEGLLFGHAWLENDTEDNAGRKVAARRSRVRLRLDSWQQGTLHRLPSTRRVASGPKAVVSALYLGYGPVSKAQELKKPPALDAHSSACLSLAYPDQDKDGKRDLLQDALSLIHAFGTLGGRSRNGWGSVWLTEQDQPWPMPELSRFTRPWRDCLRERWAHAIGCDDSGPLIWQTPPRQAWAEVIDDLGRIRKAVNGRPSKRDRPVLNQPVKGKGGRVPSNLRFKVRRLPDGPLTGVVFHMPYHCPESCVEQRVEQIEHVWAAVHRLLDTGMEGMTRRAT